VQIWDVAARKDVVRINTPAGLLGGAEYAVLTPDWKTLYVPERKRTVKAFERGGKKLYRVEESGAVRVWDVASGKEQAPLPPAEGAAPVCAKLGPDGRWLVCIERPGYETGNPSTKDMTVVWDLAAGKKSKLCEGFTSPSFAPDGKTLLVRQYDYDAKTSDVKLLDLATGKELARLSCPEKDRFFSGGQFSPDGSVVAVALGGKKAAPVEVWFLDGRTLEARGKLIGQGDPERYGWGSGRFAPDGKRYVAVDGAGNALVWDVAGGKVERTLSLGGGRWVLWALPLVFSPDGQTLAAAWAPKADADVDDARDPDPRDLPQPRVSLVDLTGRSPPRVLVAPHGDVGGLAFSPDGKTLAFGGAGAVHLFDLRK
jgi:WD40 repeat protein